MDTVPPEYESKTPGTRILVVKTNMRVTGCEVRGWVEMGEGIYVAVRPVSWYDRTVLRDLCPCVE
jgi:hypothetical protein